MTYLCADGITISSRLSSVRCTPTQAIGVSSTCLANSTCFWAIHTTAVDRCLKPILYSIATCSSSALLCTHQSTTTNTLDEKREKKKKRTEKEEEETENKKKRKIEERTRKGMTYLCAGSVTIGGALSRSRCTPTQTIGVSSTCLANSTCSWAIHTTAVDRCLSLIL